MPDEISSKFRYGGSIPTKQVPCSATGAILGSSPCRQRMGPGSTEAGQTPSVGVHLDIRSRGKAKRHRLGIVHFGGPRIVLSRLKGREITVGRHGVPPDLVGNSLVTPIAGAKPEGVPKNLPRGTTELAVFIHQAGVGTENQTSA